MNPRGAASAPADPQRMARLLVWWMVWLAIFSGAIAIYALFGGKPPVGQASPALAYAGVPPLVVSCVLRWFVFPRMADPPKAFVVFVVGLALAEGCTILAVFLGGEHRDALAVFGLVGVLQWMPLFTSRLVGRAASSGSPFREPHHHR
jgi:hypothetical protein